MRRGVLVSLALVSVMAILSLSVFQCGRTSDALTAVGGWFISDSQEVALGSQFYDEIMASEDYPPPLDTTEAAGLELNRYVQEIGRRIVENLGSGSRPENEHLEYRFTVLDDDTTVNAFAVPGGFICIYTGLVKAAEYEDEIAGVIAHEVGHVTQRHYIDALGLQYVKTLVFGDENNVVIDLATAIGALKMSRDNEFEADSCGVEYLSQAGYSPSGMHSFLQKLAEHGSWTFEPLSTHPDTDKRVAEARRLADKQSSAVSMAPKEVPARWQ